MDITEITQDELKTFVYYDPETGLFKNLISRQARLAGVIKGSLVKGGYLSTMIMGKSYLLHRIAWLYIYGVLPKNGIDHIDGNKANNQIKNLREATDKQNMQNLRVPKKHNKLGVLGVSKNGSGFRAELTIDGNKNRLRKSFKTLNEAKNQYLKWKREFHEYCTI